MRIHALAVLLFVGPLVPAQGPSQAAQAANQQAQRDAAEAQRQADIGLQAHQQATRLAQAIPPAAHVAVTRKPTFSPKPGTYSTVQQVIIADRTKGAVIYFTTDGSTPTVNSQHYTGPISLSTTTTALKAIAVAPSSTNSPRAMGRYGIR